MGSGTIQAGQMFGKSFYLGVSFCNLTAFSLVILINLTLHCTMEIAKLFGHSNV